MKTLSQTYTRNGYTYTLECRTEHAAMYKMHKGERFVGWEVGRVKTRKDGAIAGKFIEGGEVFWADEDFGSMAKWFNDETMANFWFAEFHQDGVDKATQYRKA